MSLERLLSAADVRLFPMLVDRAVGGLGRCTDDLATPRNEAVHRLSSAGN